MHVAWVMEQGRRCLVVDLVPQSITLAMGQLDGIKGGVPLIWITYTLPQLKLFLPTLTQMRNLQIAPEVYIWKRTKRRPGPELRVNYRIPVAGHELLAPFMEGSSLGVVSQVDELSFTAELLVASAGNVDYRMTETFFRTYRRRAVAGMFVAEEEKLKTTGYGRNEVHPIARFALTNVNTTAPPPLL